MIFVEPFWYLSRGVNTGLVFLRARWYDPRPGRFVSNDPFPGYTGLPQTLNAYVYCLDNPINMVDPSGEIPPWLAATFIIGETLDPLPLDPLVWTLVAWLTVDTAAKTAPDAIRTIGRLVDPPVREPPRHVPGGKALRWLQRIFHKGQRRRQSRHSIRGFRCLDQRHGRALILGRILG